MTQDKKYSWRDPDVALLITKDYIEEDLEYSPDEVKSELLDKDGKISNEIFEEIEEEIREDISFYLMGCYGAVSHRLARDKRNEGAESLNPHYRVYWKNPNAYQNDFKLIGHYKNLEDARDYVSEQFKDEFTSYAIKEFRDGIEGENDLAPKSVTQFNGANYAF